MSTCGACVTGGTVYPFDKVCICTGARPDVIMDHPLVMGIRDTEVRVE